MAAASFEGTIEIKDGAVAAQNARRAAEQAEARFPMGDVIMLIETIAEAVLTGHVVQVTSSLTGGKMLSAAMLSHAGPSISLGCQVRGGRRGAK